MNRPIQTREEFALLSAETGLSVEFLGDVAARARAEHRRLDAMNGLRETRGRDPRQLLTELHAKRWPSQPKSARQRLLETLAMRWPEHEQP